MNDVKKTKRKLPSIIRWTLWVLLVQFILLNISSSIYAYRLTHLYNESSDAGSGNIFSRTWKLFTGPKQQRMPINSKPVVPYSEFSLNLENGDNIVVWHSKHDTIAKGTVIFFHGITANKSTLIDEAHEFYTEGFNTMLVDLRAHGQSTGDVTTIGYDEDEEVKLVFDHVVKSGEKTIILYGVSLGAVVVAKAVADHNLDVDAVILDMPFASLQSYLKDKARSLGFPGQPFAALTTFWIGVEKGFNGFNHKTTSYVSKLKCPVLMQWGTHDNFILRNEMENIFNSIGSPNKRLVEYERAGHESFLNHNPVKWRFEVMKFLFDGEF